MHKWLWRSGAALILALSIGPITQVKAEEAVAGISVTLDKAEPDDIRQAIYNFSPADIKILQRIVEAEMTGQDIECKKNVASVVINRVFSGVFPDNIYDVVFQRYQFSPIGDRRYYDVEVTEDTIEAVNYTLEYGPITNALYFRATLAPLNSWWSRLHFIKEDTSGTYYYY